MLRQSTTARHILRKESSSKKRSKPAQILEFPKPRPKLGPDDVRLANLIAEKLCDRVQPIPETDFEPGEWVTFELRARVQHIWQHAAEPYLICSVDGELINLPASAVKRLS